MTDTPNLDDIQKPAAGAGSPTLPASDQKEAQMNEINQQAKAPPKPTAELRPRIVVLGVGGAGGNAVNNMIKA